ncbi:Autophagy-related protein [Pseudohyphozyma bogoriensis]|nr:Autophagy-related protein [Pseudohyphozyma bogoriensis]
MASPVEVDKKGASLSDVVVAEDFVHQADAVPFEADVERKTTTKYELWTYYLAFVGYSGLGPYNYGSSQYQNVLYLAAGDSGLLQWGGKLTPVASVVLDISGISFAVQAFVLIFLGSFADYGAGGFYIEVVFTVLAWIFGFAWLGVTHASQWKAAIALYVLGSLAYNVSWAFYVSVSSPPLIPTATDDCRGHVGIARDLPEAIESEKQVLAGTKTATEHAALDIKLRNVVADIANIVCDIGACVVLLIAVGILWKTDRDGTEDQNTRSYSIIIGFGAAVWIITVLPYWYFRQRRPAQALPAGANYLTIGFINAWQALLHIKYLKQAGIYLLAYFIVGDTLNTAATLESVLQNQVIEFNTFQYNLISLLGFACQGVGMAGCWYLTKKLGVQTKTIMLGICLFTTLVTGWGFIGYWTPHFGYKTHWEIWLFSVINGMFVTPFYQVSFIMIGDLVPKTKMYLFFALFGILGKTSSFIGPFVTSAIIDDAGGNENAGFLFLFPLTIIGTIVMWLVNPTKARIESKAYLDAEGAALYGSQAAASQSGSGARKDDDESL